MTLDAMEQTKTLSLRAAYIFGAEKGLQPEVDAIKNMEIEWDRPYTSSLKRGYIVELFEKHGLFEDFKAKYWTFGNTPKGQSLRRRFLRIKEQYVDWLKHSDNPPLDDDEAGDDQALRRKLIYVIFWPETWIVLNQVFVCTKPLSRTA